MEFKSNMTEIKRLRDWYNGYAYERLVIDTIHGVNIPNLIDLVTDGKEDYTVIILGDYYRSMFENSYKTDYIYMYKNKELNDMNSIIDAIEKSDVTFVCGFNFLDYDDYLYLTGHCGNKFAFIGDSNLPKTKLREEEELGVDTTDSTMNYPEMYQILNLYNADVVLNVLNKLPMTVQDLVYLCNRFRKGQMEMLTEVVKPAYVLHKQFEITSDDMLSYDILITHPNLINMYNKKYRSEILQANDGTPIVGDRLIFTAPFIQEKLVDTKMEMVKFEKGDIITIKEISYSRGDFVMCTVENINTLEECIMNIDVEKLNLEWDDNSSIRTNYIAKESYPNLSYAYATNIENILDKVFDSVLIDAYMDVKTRYCYGAIRTAQKRVKLLYKDSMIY